MMQQKIVILIPAYQPSTKLVNLVNELLQQDTGQIIQNIVLVDDGSGKDYQAIFTQLATLPKVHVCAHAINLGKGSALKTGFNYILLTHQNIQSIITADADGQHLVEDILKVAHKALSSSQNSFILGARTFSNQVPLRSLFGNQITRLVMYFFTGLKLADTQTGLRAWPLELCLSSLQITSVGYDFETDALLKAKEFRDNEENFEILEIPIQTIYDEGNTTSHFNPVLDSMKIYFIFLRYCSASFMTVVVDYLFFSIALLFSSSIAIAMVFGRFAATIVSFLLNKKFVFQSNQKYLRVEFLKFVSVVIFLGLIAYLAIAQLTFIGINVYVAKIFVEVTLFFATFSILNNLIFKRGN